MVNRINQVVVLENGKKYFILKQAVYSGDNYFVVAEVTDDEQDLKEKFAVLHETIENGETYIEFEKNPSILEILFKHLKLEEE